ncbi:MAG: hypothetical protein HKM89_07950 [Gemmatimonadales bacterium]|nr:hypothetical protein [Gemmatimonadales bacterium]
MAGIQSVPFSIEPELSDIRKGWITITGVLRMDRGNVVLEYRTSFVEQSDIIERSISLDDLTRVEYRRGIFGAKLILQAKSLAVFDGMPGTSEDRLVLGIARRDRPAGKAIGWQLGTLLENRKLGRSSGESPSQP